MNSKLKIIDPKLNFANSNLVVDDKTFIDSIKSDSELIKYLDKYNISDQEIIENRNDFSIMRKNNSSKDVFFLIQVRRNQNEKLEFYSTFSKNSITKNYMMKENIAFTEISKPTTDVISSNISQIKRGNAVWEFLKNLKKDKNKFFENFYVYGDVDSVRQEFLSSYVNLIAQKNFNVAYIDINLLDDYVKNSLKKENSNEIINNLIYELSQIEYLAIDEIGLKTLSSWFLERVFLNIISNRLSNNKKVYFGAYFSLSFLHKYIFKDDAYIVSDSNSKKVKKLKPLATKIIKTMKLLSEPKFLWIDDKYLEDK
ncbi:hypothetical protein JXZ92_01755 [Mycoplasma sp. CSL10137]|uniref:hypothetical protein n=1 Tax=unclassified Mycoplasma TaxID=2683645 RepID=UPI00197BC103|nr:MULTISPECIES: hypothetical protein [unclassified Mycoplasma]MBN4083545.1 hypothetical protein [Mycoplasma sp. CSL10137]MBN4084525.1 hypothetical protein [Mycoplasma sp. CSL10166]MBU4693003.1 hypothetical protein [Mycoplasma sp. CSL7491-lung]